MESGNENLCFKRKGCWLPSVVVSLGCQRGVFCLKYCDLQNYVFVITGFIIHFHSSQATLAQELFSAVGPLTSKFTASVSFSN